jgi:hypothetical protein
MNVLSELITAMRKQSAKTQRAALAAVVRMVTEVMELTVL